MVGKMDGPFERRGDWLRPSLLSTLETLKSMAVGSSRLIVNASSPFFLKATSVDLAMTTQAKPQQTTSVASVAHRAVQGCDAR